MERIITDPQEKQWGMFCHLSALAMFIIPFGNIIGPLVIYLLKKDEYGFVADQGKESLNFQISMYIYLILAGILVLLLIGILAIFIIPLYALIMIIVASSKSSNGEFFRYPGIIRFIK